MITKHNLFILLPGLALAACQSPETSTTPELTDRTWQLVELASGAGPITPSGEEPLTATFTAEGVSGSTGCNQYRSTWQRDGGRLTIAGEITATERFCDDLMKQELLFLDQLKQTDSFAVRGDTLLLFGNGDQLVFLEQRGGETQE